MKKILWCKNYEHTAEIFKIEQYLFRGLFDAFIGVVVVSV